MKKAPLPVSQGRCFYIIQGFYGSPIAGAVKDLTSP